MAKKPPPVSLRKPPAAVDLDRAEAFVRKTEEPNNVQTVKRPEVQTLNRSEAQTAKVEDAPTSERSEAHTTAAPVETVAPPRKHVPKSVVARNDGRTLRRMTVYLPDELARRLAVHCAREDLELSAFVSEAVLRRLDADSD
jgi:hypothetical protein